MTRQADKPDNCPRCALGAMIPNDMNQEEVKRAGWQSLGILVISPDDQRIRHIERQIIDSIGNRLYGRRD